MPSTPDATSTTTTTTSTAAATAVANFVATRHKRALGGEAKEKKGSPTAATVVANAVASPVTRHKLS
eukprot:2342146-Prorocentrum_lima.AAC.1